MEIFMCGISYTAKKNDVKVKIAQVIHSSDYAEFSTIPLNLEVFLFRNKRGGPNTHSGLGVLTLPIEEVGEKFLAECGGQFPRRRIIVGNKFIKFEKSKSSPKQDILGECGLAIFGLPINRREKLGDIRRLPYVDPIALEEKERREEQLDVNSSRISEIAFGKICCTREVIH
jgi:RNA-dependent RNA polymerase